MSKGGRPATGCQCARPVFAFVRHLLITSPRVPLRWRRLFVLAVYLYARAGEISALRWMDVDLEHGTIHIHRSIDRVRKRKVGSTKSDRARRIPIEPALLPLLTTLFIEAKGTGPVFRMPSVGVLSTKLKHYLRRAGVTREELFVTTRRARPSHSTISARRALRGAPSAAMTRSRSCSGHTDFETTKIYLREAENLATGFGVVFPALPATYWPAGV